MGNFDTKQLTQCVIAHNEEFKKIYLIYVKYFFLTFFNQTILIKIEIQANQ